MWRRICSNCREAKRGAEVCFSCGATLLVTFGRACLLLGGKPTKLATGQQDEVPKKAPLDKSHSLLRIRLNSMNAVSSSLAGPSSRWLGVSEPSSPLNGHLSSTHGDRLGRSWQSAFPAASISVLLPTTGRILWTESVSHGGSAEPHWQELAGKMLWIRQENRWPGSLRLVGEAQHSALLVSFPIRWVEQKLSSIADELSIEWRGLLLGGSASTVRPMEAEDRSWARGLMAPSLCEAARQLLEGSRLSEFFYRKVLLEAQGQEFFCTRTRRIALERVERVRRALRDRLENPPSLEELAALCGCNTHYLSRTFTAEAGMTITHYLRKLRIEKAATLLARGSHNASEAALEVGYQSMSHFSVAFKQVQGWTPTQWLRQQATKDRQSLATAQQHNPPSLARVKAQSA